jgi:hypothetical protein
MAVVQISKIQQRRGQKLLSGLPQLSSAELAWAVDTQELYIGNGSVGEGAPYVGNTRILTEHDNLLALAGSYKFAEPDLSITASVFRSIQTKLDEIEVSVIDFGPEPDPSTDHTEYFHIAFNQLFQNADTKFRKVLVVPNGHYYFKTTLKIPSNVILKGETRTGVILDIGTTGIEFLSESGSDVLTFTSTNRPENISIGNLTIAFTSGETNLTGLKDSRFENITWKGTYQLGDDDYNPILASQSYDLSSITTGGYITVTGSGIGNNWPGIQVYVSSTVASVTALVNILNNTDNLFPNANLELRKPSFSADIIAESLVITALTGSTQDIENFITIRLKPSTDAAEFMVEPTPTNASTGINTVNSALSWENNFFGTRVHNIDFIGCSFDSVTLAAKCIHTHSESDYYETELVFDDCDFYICDTAVYIEGVTDLQTNNWSFGQCRFEDIAKQALYSTKGHGTSINDTIFKNVGNGINGNANPETEMVIFGTKYGNVVTNCRSDRHQEAGITLVNTTVGIAEVVNAGSVNFTDDYYSIIYLSDTFIPLAVFSTKNRYIIIDYNITLGEYSYNRKGTLSITISDSVGDPTDHVAITDNYTYSSSLITDLGGPVMTNFEFDAELKDSTNVGDDSTVNPADPDTILLTYKNPLQYSGTGTISYSIRYGV